jgi:hypothetical protein
MSGCGWVRKGNVVYEIFVNPLSLSLSLSLSTNMKNIFLRDLSRQTLSLSLSIYLSLLYSLSLSLSHPKPNYTAPTDGIYRTYVKKPLALMLVFHRAEHLQLLHLVLSGEHRRALCAQTLILIFSWHILSFFLISYSYF